MSEPTRRSLVVKNIPDCEPEIGRWLWALDDARQRTRKALEGLNPAVVDWASEHHNHTIGSVLYHIAAIEMDWFAVEVMEGKLPQSAWNDFPYEVRDAQGHLTHVDGLNLAEHWRRLDSVREMLMNAYKFMSLDEFRRVRVLDDYVVTPEWVLHHLCQHEAEHRSELAAIRAAAEKSLE